MAVAAMEAEAMAQCPHGEECEFVRICQQPWSVDAENAEEVKKVEEHFRTYSHARTPCRHGADCTRHRRAKLQKLLSKQGERNRAVEAQLHRHVFSHGNESDEPSGDAADTFFYIPDTNLVGKGIKAIEKKFTLDEEVRANMPKWYNALAKGCPASTNFERLMQITDEKLRHPEHVRLGSPLEKDEMSAVLLYTSTKVQEDLRSSVLSGDYRRWARLRGVLEAAIQKLHAVQDLKQHPTTYSGFRDVCLDADWLDAMFPGSAAMAAGGEAVAAGAAAAAEIPPSILTFPYRYFLSTSKSKEVALNFLEMGAGSGFVFEWSIQETSAGADVSWISKYGIEQEILMAPSTIGIQSVQIEAGQPTLIKATLIPPGSMRQARLQGDITIVVPLHVKPQIRRAVAPVAAAGSPAPGSGDASALIAPEPASAGPSASSASAKAVPWGFRALRVQAKAETKLFNIQQQIYRDSKVPPGQQRLKFLEGAVQAKLEEAQAKGGEGIEHFAHRTTLRDLGLHGGSEVSEVSEVMLCPTTLGSQVSTHEITRASWFPLPEHLYAHFELSRAYDSGHRFPFIICRACRQDLVEVSLAQLLPSPTGGYCCVAVPEDVKNVTWSEEPEVKWSKKVKGAKRSEKVNMWQMSCSECRNDVGNRMPLHARTSAPEVVVLKCEHVSLDIQTDVDRRLFQSNKWRLLFDGNPCNVLDKFSKSLSPEISLCQAKVMGKMKTEKGFEEWCAERN
mmetsp:Transcript_46740/g.138064  ORF Transcript_46740/g.138064 Transcript_46740/m.138064 type:complete len:733 (+) Transcript_46740:79-2277(+)